MKTFKNLNIGQQFCLTENSADYFRKVTSDTYITHDGGVIKIYPMTPVYGLTQQMWVVFEERDTVNPPKKVEINEIRCDFGVRTDGKGVRRAFDRYILNDSPYEIDIVQGEFYSSNEGHSTGFDTWQWTHHCFLNESDAIQKYNDLIG